MHLERAECIRPPGASFICFHCVIVSVSVIISFLFSAESPTAETRVELRSEGNESELGKPDGQRGNEI